MVIGGYVQASGRRSDFEACLLDGWPKVGSVLQLPVSGLQF